MRYIENQYRSLFFGMIINFVLFGVTIAMLGSVLPKAIREFHWSYTAAGIVISACAIGYFVSTFLSGILVQRLGPKLVVVIGLGLQTIGLLFFAWSSLFLLNTFLNFLIGLGQGATEIVANFSVVRIERSGRSRMMSFLHAAFSVGAIVGPIILGMIVGAGLSWWMIYRLTALISFLMAIFLALLPFSRLSGEDDESGNGTGLIELLKHPLIILSFLVLFLYVGTEHGVSSWIAEYYVKIFGTPAETGAFMVSVFWAGVLVGRLAVSFGYRGYRQAEVLLVLAVTCTTALIFALLMKGPWLAGVGFFVAGLGFSAIYPLVIVLVGKYFRQGQGAAIGFVATGGGIGEFLFPFFMAAISDRLGIHRGFIFYIALDVIMTLLICATILQTRKLDHIAATESV